tara:strand:+ start:9337 stop:15732 length:6396 start_codon:yes stop_codon:yes gene_type:complete
MKHIFRSFIRLLSLVIFLYPIVSNANAIATSHTINSGNFYYNPSSLTISIGDTVTWVNDGGFHDVNFAVNTITGVSYTNPESFASTATSSDTLYTHVFTIAGTYNYDCSVGAHAANGMVGTIIVTANSGCTDPNAINYDAAADTDDGSCIDLCSPDPQYNSEGIYPNSLDDGYVGQIYDEAVTIVVPLTVVSNGLTVNVDNIDLTAIAGLPNNFTYACNPPNCSFAGGTSGCVNIYSTSQIDTSDIGNYPLMFYTTSTGNVGGIIPINQNDSVDTYSIEILGNAVLGCTDLTACNYDPAATSDDGSCILPDGCTDPTACNFDPLANCDDGSCLTIYGCTDITACNYDSNATCDDGSCLLVYGCTNATANNYDPVATCDDGTCTYNTGCTDSTAINYDPTSVIDDGSCIVCDLSFTTNVGDNYCPTDIAGYIELVVNGGSGPYTVTYEHMVEGLNGQMYPGYNNYNTTFGGSGLGDTLFMGNFASHNDYTLFQNMQWWSQPPSPIGNQLLTVSDTNGCTVSDSIAIGSTIPYLVDSVVILSNSSCCGACDASATVAVTGSPSSYWYSWDNGDTTAISTNLCSQFCEDNVVNYVYIIDSLGCLYGLHFLVPIDSCITGCTDPTAINYNPNATYDDSSCVACNKSVTQNLMGFDPNPLYALWDWSYDTLTVTNTGNCDVRVRPEFNISHSSLPIDSADFDLTWYNSLFNFWATIPYDIDANGNAVGFVSLDPNDSTGQIISQGTTQQVIIRVRFKPGANYGNYCAVWDAQEVDPLGNFIQSLAPGSQTCLSLVDCSNFGVDSSYTTNISCNGDLNGEAGIVSIENGSGSYTYNWSNGSTSSGINNLPAGDYYCIVTDLNWQQCTDSIVFSITEPAPLTVTTSSTPQCGAWPGTVTAIPSGGTVPYTYLWSDSTFTNANQTATNMAGSYTVYITDSNGCIIIATEVILGVTALDLTYTVSDFLWGNVSCFGASDGSITTFINSGASPVSYIWEDITNPGLTLSTDSAISSLAQGVYTLAASDSNGCAFLDTITLEDPPLVTTGLTVTNALCGNGNGQASVHPGGVAPFDWSVSWSVGGGGQWDSIISLGIGTYTVEVFNTNTGCSSGVETFTITGPPALTASYTITDVTCNGAYDGTITITPSGGTAPYSYAWTNAWYSGGIQTGLGVGNYGCLVTDADGCDIYVFITINEPPVLTGTSSFTDVSCYGASDGSATVTASGGTPGYTYLWDDPVAQTTQTATGLAPGTYTCLITDANGCTVTNTETITGPDLVTTGLVITNPTCYGDNNGYAEVFPTGVTFPDYDIYYNGALSASNIFTPANPGSYTIEIINNITGCSSGIENFTITDPAELTSSYTQTNVTCNGANDGSAIVTFFGGTIGSAPGDTNYILGWAGTPLPVYLYYPQNVFNTTLLPPPYNQIPPGVYPYTVTDLNGCTIYDTITITEPDSLSISLSASIICCYGDDNGEATAIPNGGTAPYTYHWPTWGQNSQTANTLSAGTHYCTVTDNNGCTIQDSITLTENAPITASFTTTNPLCYGDNSGCIYTTASGGDGNYTYLWGPSGQTTADICNLSAMMYQVVITDGCGCSEVFFVTISEPVEITLNIDSLDNITAYGWSDGSISISTSGGTGIMNTSWTSDNGFTSNDEDITNLFAGMYYLELSDSNGCIYLDTIELTQPSSLWMNLDLAVNTSCFDSCDGSLNITANGGDSTYTYSWIGPNNFTSIDDDISNLCDGEYIITVDDGITSITDTFNIYQPQPLTSILTVDSILCADGSAQAQINVWGGTQPFVYNWSNGGNTYITTVQAGIHEINVTDQNGCFIIESFSLTSPDSIISATTTTNVNCFGGNNGSANVSIISGGTTPYTFLWSNGQTIDSIFNLTVGIYQCTITDSNGCQDATSVVITEPDDIISSTYVINATCYGDCDGSISANAIGGTPPYTYIWNNGQTTQNAIGLCAGFYNVTITDALNCMSIDSGIVNEPNPLLVNISLVGNSLVASIGFSSYQWYNANGTIIPGETSNIFYPSSMGGYYVVVTQGICEETSYIIDYNISSINNYGEGIKIYPNPTTGLITIEGGNPNAKISIINSLGHQLITTPKSDEQESSRKLDLSDLANGIYLIQIEDDEQIFNYRIVLQ